MAINITEQHAEILIPQLTGEVEHAFEFESEFKGIFEVMNIKGTDTKIERVAGKVKVERIDWTEDDKHAQVGTFGNIQYSVDQAIYVRHAEKNIDPLLSDINAMKELAYEHGKEMAMQRDVTILTAILHGSRTAALAATGVAGVDADNDLDKVIEAGLVQTMEASGDINDALKLERKLEELIIAQRARRKLDKNSLLIVSHGVYNELRQAEKLTNSDYSPSNADYAKGQLSRFMNMAIMPVTTFQDLQDARWANNPVSDALNVSDIDKEARAVVVSPRALRILEVQPLTMDMWYEKVHKTNYIDTQAMYNVAVRRQDLIGALYTFEAVAAGAVDNVDGTAVV